MNTCCENNERANNVKEMISLINSVSNNIISNGVSSVEKEIFYLFNSIIDLNYKEIYNDISLLRLIFILDSEDIRNGLIKYSLKTIKGLILNNIFSIDFCNDTQNTIDKVPDPGVDYTPVEYPETADGTVIKGSDGNDNTIDLKVPGAVYRVIHLSPNTKDEITEIITVNDDLTINRRYEKRITNRAIDEENIELNNLSFEQILKEIESCD